MTVCVILVVRTNRPSEQMVEKAWNWNDHGGGVAWIAEEKGKKIVRWRKNLTEGEMQDACRTLPLPYVAHFRIASQGGRNPELCHPFPVVRTVPTALEGKTSSGVLFHNGTWSMWRE